MSVKYTIEPGHRDKAAIIWLVLVIIIALGVIGIAYAQQDNEYGGELIKKEVIGNIKLHLVTMIIIIILVIAAWGLGRRREEITVAPGEMVS
ncbi:hypothetical protein J4526_01590 [Desulfurococcaceae archaeon MEX13E-LK6-19]|nr:hypothetical protein J4526_01590 [Desulfurococcaceae archaeon MEX13E-LK6-19]